MESKTNIWTIVLTAVIAAAIVGSGVYFWRNQKPLSSSTEKSQHYVNKQGFSLEIPKGYSVAAEYGDGLKIVQKLSYDDVAPLPEMTMGWDSGWVIDLESYPGENKILKEESVSINGIKGKKYIVSYQWLPEGNKYPRYRLESNGVVYDIGLLNNFDPVIFANITQSFRITNK